MRSFVGNPVVQGGLDAIGSLVGDPALGQEVSQAVQVVSQAIDIVGGIGEALVPDLVPSRTEVGIPTYAVQGGQYVQTGVVRTTVWNAGVDTHSGPRVLLF